MQAQTTFTDITELILAMISEDFSKMHAHYAQAKDGFGIAAMADGRPVGFVGLSWRQLPEPVPNTLECFVDIIEVGAAYRRQGIAQKLLEIAEERARERGAYQMRAWSSEDKTEAIPMWRALGFGLSPAVERYPGEEVRGFFVSKVLGEAKS